MVAVITGDIIGSTKLQKEVKEEAIEIISQKFNKFDIWRGDSFQGELPPEEGLKNAILLKAALKKISVSGAARQSKIGVGARISIGIGKITTNHVHAKKSDGPAYQLSGRGLDYLEAQKKQFLIVSENDDSNKELEIISYFLEYIFKNWTISSAEVIYWLLQEKNEKEIAKKLNLSQSAVNQRKKAAEWETIEKILKRYQEIIHKLSINGL